MKNNKPPVFQDWLKKLKQKGKTDQEIGELLSGVAKLSGLEVYTTIMTSLTEHDMEAVEKIADDEEAKKKMEELFQKRTGMTIDELVNNAKNAFAEGYLSASST